MNINKVCKAAFIPLARALVTCRLDYLIPCTTVLSNRMCKRFKALSITKTPKDNHIKPFLKIYTGYQPVKQRSAFKMDLLVNKTLHAG